MYIKSMPSQKVFARLWNYLEKSIKPIWCIILKQSNHDYTAQYNKSQK